MLRSLNVRYGELELMRDRNDGRLYVIDLNNTPTGVAFQKLGLTESEAFSIMDRLFYHPSESNALPHTQVRGERVGTAAGNADKCTLPTNL